MPDWTSMRLGDVMTIKHGFAFPGSDFSEDPTLPTLVTPGNFMIGGGFQDARPKTFAGDVPAEYVLRPGDLVVTMTDLSRNTDTLGYPGLIPDGKIYLHNQRIGLVEVTQPSKIHHQFLNYYMRGAAYRNHVVVTASGSTVRHTSPSRILSFVGLVPSLDMQRGIAEVLGALDDKIAANSTLVAIGEDLAGALVRDAVGVGSQSLGSIAAITMGSSPPGTSYNEVGKGMVFYQGVRDFGVRSPSNRVWTTEPVRTAEAGDTLVSVRAPVGRTNVATETTCLGRGLAGLRSDSPSTIYHLLRSVPEVWAPYEAEGTVFGSINKTQLDSLPVPVVEPSHASALEVRLSAIDRRVTTALDESAMLAATRDALLPLLMSGKVKVKDAESVVGGVI